MIWLGAGRFDHRSCRCVANECCWTARWFTTLFPAQMANNGCTFLFVYQMCSTFQQRRWLGLSA